MKRKIGSMLLVPLLALVALATDAPEVEAQDLIYQPVTSMSSFGGGANFQSLMQAAQAQRPQEDFDRFTRDPLQDFEQGLQRSLLNQLSREIVQSRFGEGVNLQEGGTFELGTFVVDVTPGSDGIQIRVLNTVTGDQTFVTVPAF